MAPNCPGRPSVACSRWIKPPRCSALIVMGVLAFIVFVIAARYAVLRYYDSRARSAQVKCPDCATLLPREARVCRHCGYRLGAMPPPG